MLQTNSLQITPDRMSLGQDYTPMVVQVQNNPNLDAAAARLDSIKIIANGSIVTDPNILDIVQVSTLPITLQQGNQVALNFQIRPGLVPNTYNYEFTDLL